MKTFTVSDKEETTANEWLVSHDCKPSRNGKKTRAGITYSFGQTGIGTVVTVKCTSCGETHNVTDYDSW